jgi:hypothetical protein
MVFFSWFYDSFRPFLTSGMLYALRRPSLPDHPARSCCACFVPWTFVWDMDDLPLMRLEPGARRPSAA